jgi:N-acetylmuramoyl-L-alanine amidase
MPADLPTELPVQQDLLPYVTQLQARSEAAIEGVVIHCTETPDLATARSFGERVLYASGTGNSGHFYIDLDGSIWQYVSLNRTAHHVRGMNDRSIGIELVNRGRWPRWYDSDHQGMDQPYTQAQIEALIRLLQKLEDELPQLRWIAGHEDLDTARMPAQDDPNIEIARKVDPGPKFPWDQVLAHTSLERRSGDPAP